MHAVPPHEFPEPVDCRRRAGTDGFMVEKSLDILRQRGGRLVATPCPLRQCLHHNPVEIAAHESAEARGVNPCVAAILGRASEELIRLLGVGGSTSRISRSNLPIAALTSVSRNIGVLPVNNSYRITPRE